MRWIEVLLLPKCEVAEDVIHCWHDVIKNKIQSFGDPFLESWLDETESVQEFEAALEHVVTDLEGFSPARAAAKLAPVASMPETTRRELLAKLEDRFQRRFGPAKVRERLRAVVDPLKDALRDCTESRDKSERMARLTQLRSTGADAKRVLETLPPGFLILRDDSDD